MKIRLCEVFEKYMDTTNKMPSVMQQINLQNLTNDYTGELVCKAIDFVKEAPKRRVCIKHIKETLEKWATEKTTVITNTSNKYDLDGSKIYNVDTGETVFDLEELPPELLWKLYMGLLKEKELRQQLEKNKLK